MLENLPMPHRVRLPDPAVRYLAWLCLFSMLWPAFVVAAQSPPPETVPVVTRISGAVSVRSRGGVSNEVLSSRIIHSGDLLMTGVDSLASIGLADVGSVRVGPTSMATASVSAGSLRVSIGQGSACAQAVSKGVSIAAGALVLTAADQTAIFSLTRSSSSTTLAVYQGSVIARMGTVAGPFTFKAGDAAVSSGGAPQHVEIASVQPSFAALQCPDPSVIASVLPSPSPSPAAGGHGGGAGGILAALLGLGAIAAAAGHGGGGGGGSSPPTSPPTSPPPGSLQVSVQSLTFPVDGAQQTFTASEANYQGPINAVSNDPTVATVSPASGNGPNPVTFTVTPLGAGGSSTTITVSDNRGNAQTVSVTIAQPGAITVNPNQLTFLSSGTSQTFTAKEPNFSGPLSAVSSNTGVAMVAGSGNGPGPVTFTVTPVAAGTATITVSGTGTPATVSVTVIGPLQAMPNTLAFLGNQHTHTFTATDPFYTGVLSASSDTPSVATVAPNGSPNGPSAQFTVTAVNQGNATITVSDTFGGSTTVSVSVSAGGLVVNPTSLTFLNGGAPQPFTASESNYTGVISAASNDTPIATVFPSSGQGPGPVTFTVMPGNSGNTTITVFDSLSHSNTVHVTVTGPLTVGPPSSLTFNGTTAPKTLNVSDPNYSGAITASSSNVGVATVTSSMNGPNATFSVTPVSSGNATITFTDANGGSATASVTVNPGPLSVSTSSVTLPGAGSTQPFNATEVFYTGSIAAMSQDTTVATVAPASRTGPGPVTFTLTAVGPGSTNVIVTDDHSGSQMVAVTVSEAPALSPTSVTLTDVGPPGKTVSISEPGYSGAFSIVSNTCASMGIANVGSPGNGPNSTVSVTGNTGTVMGGPCTFKVQDSLANTSSPENVTVGPFGAITPSPTGFTFTDVGKARALNVSESNYTGQFTIDASACSGTATVSPTSSTGSFTVTSTGSGGPCNLSITDDHASTAVQVPVTVGPFGTISPTPGSLSLTVGGGSGTFTVAENNYSGQFTLDASLCSGIASASPTTGTSSTTFTVSTIAAGNCKIVVSDDHGQMANVDVFVTAGSLIVNPNTLQFAGGSAGSMQTFTASDTSCLVTDTITATADGTVAASVSPSGPQTCLGGVTFTVTAGSNGRGFVNVTDTAGGMATVSVGVGMSPLIKVHKGLGKHKPVTAPGSPPPGGRGPVAGPIAPPRPLPPAPAPSHGPGLVPPGLLRASLTSLTLVQNGLGQTLTIAEPGYLHAFRIVIANPGVAAASAATALGPSATVTISPRGAGVTTIQIADDHGGVQIIQVIVRALSPRKM